jgi:hypothetical protein
MPSAIKVGKMAEWLKATDCKSVEILYVGSNPTLPNLATNVFVY